MKQLIKRLEIEINKTPTGELRNLLCDVNIRLHSDQKLMPITITTTENDLEGVFFDFSIIINKDNEASILDNSQYDWRDAVDCSTLVYESFKISVK